MLTNHHDNNGVEQSTHKADTLSHECIPGYQSANHTKHFCDAHRLRIPCDCAADVPCGTWLELTPEGILVLEDKDNLQVSCDLPEWLDAAIRYAIQRHKLKISISRRLAIVFEYDGSDRMNLSYITATLQDVFDSAAWVAHINGIPIHEVNLHFAETVIPPSLTTATDDHRESFSDDVPF